MQKEDIKLLTKGVDFMERVFMAGLREFIIERVSECSNISKEELEKLSTDELANLYYYDAIEKDMERRTKYES